MTIDCQGTRANLSGAAAEWQVMNILQQYGLKSLDPEELKKLKKRVKDGFDPVETLKSFGPAVFAPQIKTHSNLFNAQHMTDIFAYHAVTLPEGLVIEVKWQATPGSVDEKLVFTVASLILAPSPALLVIDGGGARPAAVEWARNRTKDNMGLTVVDSIGAFSRWARKHIQE